MLPSLFIALWLVSTNALVIPFHPFLALAQTPMVSWFGTEEDGYRSNPQFELWINSQTNQSFHYILENIGGISSSLDPKEVASGVVVALPLRRSPNYFYNWIRDSALTIRSLVYHMDDHHPQENLQTVVERYIEVNYHLQRLPNRSGKFDDPDRAGLGEPKFMPDGTTFDDNWGRPQSDGPGLRVLTIANYLNYLRKHNMPVASDFLGNASFVYTHIVRPDLEYVMRNWNMQAFDLWEEINLVHFFSALTQLRALSDGIRLARRYDESSDFMLELQSLYDELRAFIVDPATGFTRSTVPYVIETPDLFADRKRSGLDAASLLAALHAHNLDLNDTDDVPFDVDDSRILNTISAMVADMKYRYPINHDKIRLRQNIGVGLGRYPEDVYDGYSTSEGNPWFISTASAAEIVFKWIYKKVSRQQDIIITLFNKDFFGALLDDVSDDELGAGDYVIPYGSDRYRRVLVSMFNYSDSFMDVIQSHVDLVTGQMLEQFNKYHGYMQGADNLTWSYLSFYNCVRWRLKASFQIDNVCLSAKL